MWALLDNYDSFTHILYHYLLQLHGDVRIWRNDEISAEALKKLNPERIILSPGPGRPSGAGITMEVIAAFHSHIPVLGICLGHQAIGEFFGARLQRSALPRHGRTSSLQHQGHPLFSGLPAEFPVMRYHSLELRDWEAAGLEPLAFSDDGVLMAFRHLVFPVTGMQFHPESVLTAHGLQLLRNWAAL